MFLREDTSTERRVLAAFLCHAKLSHRKIESFVDRSHEAVHQWCHRIEHLFEPDCRERGKVTVDETRIAIDGEMYIRAAADCKTLEVLAMEVSPGRSSLDAFFDVLEWCRGRPPVQADRGPWYDLPLRDARLRIRA